MLKKAWFWVVLGVIAISLLLRVYHFDRYPLDSSSDGLTYSWVGTSLLNNPGKPQGMSLFVANNPSLFWFSHHNYFDTVRRYDFRLVDPFLDQPSFLLPVLGVLPKLFGYSDFEPLPEALIRLPALIASAFTLGLSYVLAAKLFGHKIGFLTLLVLGFTPFYVFAHREALIENFLTPVYLGGLFTLLKYLETRKRSWMMVLLVFVVLAPLLKVVGIALAAMVVFWLWKEREYKLGGVALGLGLASLVAYFGYGFFLNKEAFSWILQAQSSRGVYAASFIDFLLKPEFYEQFKDGWYLFNFVTFFWLLLTQQKQRNLQFVLSIIVIILISILGTAGLNNNFPWYRYPLFPFLSMSTALFLWQMITQKKNAIWLLIFALFGFADLNLMAKHWPLLGNSLLLRVGLLLLLGNFFAQEILPLKVWPKLNKGVAVGAIVLALGLNMLVVFSYPKIFCEQQECKLPTKIVVPI
jgi:4-amino-4-deoxy-L-arabinose transferase-like glycosyltransferase